MIALHAELQLLVAEMNLNSMSNHLSLMPELMVNRSESQSSIDATSQILTPSPSPSSEEKSLIPEDSDQITVPTGQKKKKKKKTKSAKAKDAAIAAAKAKEELEASRPPVLCISRNKHWRYISSYHVSLFHKAQIPYPKFAV